MSALSEYVATLESQATSEYKTWIDSVGGYSDGLPESMKDLCKSFFIAGFYRGSASGASAYHNATKGVLGISTDSTKGDEAR